MCVFVCVCVCIHELLTQMFVEIEQIDQSVHQ